MLVPLNVAMVLFNIFILFPWKVFVSPLAKREAPLEARVQIIYQDPMALARTPVPPLPTTGTRNSNFTSLQGVIPSGMTSCIGSQMLMIL